MTTSESRLARNGAYSIKKAIRLGIGPWKTGRKCSLWPDPQKGDVT